MGLRKLRMCCFTTLGAPMIQSRDCLAPVPAGGPPSSPETASQTVTRAARMRGRLLSRERRVDRIGSRLPPLSRLFRSFWGSVLENTWMRL
uniref:Uncharacterized protein n=1 Tax=Ixodes ricinus TaxID=34613 RepID=A0A6B0UBQ5_IXORI